MKFVISVLMTLALFAPASAQSNNSATPFHSASVATRPPVTDADALEVRRHLLERGPERSPNALGTMNASGPPAAVTLTTRKQEGFHWGTAVGQDLILVAIQNGGNLAMDRWMRYDLTHGRFFHKWFTSVKNIRWSVWNDNDPFLDDYIAHPMQGALTGFIQIQNDPKYRGLEQHNTPEYWRSRLLRAFAWQAFWSTQWKIGPFSEASIGNTGYAPYWSKDSHGMTNGTGLVDFIMTPVGGTFWLLGEDFIDLHVIRRLERVSQSRLWLLPISVLNPTRAGANILRFKPPYYRDSRNPRARKMARTGQPDTQAQR